MNCQYFVSLSHLIFIYIAYHVNIYSQTLGFYLLTFCSTLLEDALIPCKNKKK